MLLEAFADDRQHAVIDEACNRILYEDLVFAQLGTNIEEIERIQRLTRLCL
jgi:hypothetical protein